MKTDTNRNNIKSIGAGMMKGAHVLLALAAVGCQTLPYQPYARDVKRKPMESGIVALKLEHRDEDRAKATEMMAANCGTKKPVILEEGEVVVGQTTQTNGNTDYHRGSSGKQVGSLFGMPITSGASNPGNSTSETATTNAIKEWQIAYNCGGKLSAGKNSDSSSQ